MKNILEHIRPARTMGIEVSEWNAGRVVLSAPLAKNLNDKGTGFAGSIDAILDLAGWSAITLALRDAGLTAEVMIVKSETQYSSAVRADMTASAELSAEDIERMVMELKTRGRSRMGITAHLEADNKKCAVMTAHYAIIANA